MRTEQQMSEIIHRDRAVQRKREILLSEPQSLDLESRIKELERKMEIVIKEERLQDIIK